MELPQEINNYHFRKLELDNLSVIEYSKKPTFTRYLSKFKIDEGDLLYEVRAKTINEAKKLMLKKLELINLFKQDFKEQILFENNPCFYDSSVNNSSIAYKFFTIFDIVDVDRNSKSISIISIDLDLEIDLILKYILELIKVNITNKIKFSGKDFNSEDLVFTNTIYLYTTTYKTDEKTIRKRFREKNLTLKMRDKEYRDNLKPDFFICHDSRDKNDIARPLAEKLKNKGLKVWYDEYSLKIGDSLFDAIQDGIKKCQYAIIIISPNFLSNKTWAHSEFQSITTKQITTNSKVILPIWHNIQDNDYEDMPYYIRDKVAGNTKNGLDSLANQLFDLK